MQRLKPERRLRENLPESRRTDRPLFFDPELADWDLSNHIEIPLTTALKNIEPIQGHTHRILRHIFKSRVHRNEEGLRLAYVNKHDAPHMDRVANGTFHMGAYLGMDMTQVKAATLAARFHDVGYEFPEGADPSTMEGLGKELHTNHAPDGAEMVTESLLELYRSDSAAARELADWTDDTFIIAHEAIRLHSNDVGTDESANPVTLLPRLIDKIDNTQARVRPEHIEDFSKSVYRNVQHIQHRVKRGCRHAFSSEVVNGRKRKRHGMDLPEVREHLSAVDPYYYHRIAPLAISDQRLFLNPQDVSAVLEYRVYPSVVSDALKVDYRNEDHEKDFREAYDKSMLNAANVMRLLRVNQLGSADPHGETLLTVRLVYEDGHQRVLTYGPEMFASKEEQEAPVQKV